MGETTGVLDPARQRKADQWYACLEGLLPRQIDGITPEGTEPLIRYQYVPGSLTIDRIVDDPPGDLGEARYIIVAYRVKMTTLEDDKFPVDILVGTQELPLTETDQLVLAAVNWLEGLEKEDGVAV